MLPPLLLIEGGLVIVGLLFCVCAFSRSLGGFAPSAPALFCFFCLSVHVRTLKGPSSPDSDATPALGFASGPCGPTSSGRI